MFHYNKLNDDSWNWDGVKFATGKRDIDRFEENKLVSIDVFETADFTKLLNSPNQGRLDCT